MHRIDFGRTDPVPVKEQLKALRSRQAAKATGVPDRFFAQPQPVFLKPDRNPADPMTTDATDFAEWLDRGVLPDVRLLREPPSCETTEGCNA